MKIQYIRVGDYYIPDLTLPEETRPLGKWGRMRREYLKEHKPLQYNCLLLSDLYEVLNASVEAEPVCPGVAKSSIHLNGSRILLVEDNDLNREIAAAILSEMDVQVEEAENGKVALEMIRSSMPGYYKLVLMDIQMPVMDGYSATRAIRALDRPDVKTLPIIAVSANAFEEDMLKSKEAGMNEHIAKPFNRRKLEEVIGKYSR